MSYTIEVEKLKSMSPDLEDLYKQHYAEIQAGMADVGIPIADYDPNWASYYEMEDAQSMVTLVARDDNGIAVGYFSVQFVTDLTNGEFTAYDQAVFITPLHRGYGVGKFLSKAVMDLLKSMHVKRLIINCPVGSRAADVYQHMGFKPIFTQLAYTFKE